MWDDDSRGNTIFRLREHFPLYRGDPHKFASPKDVPNPTLALDNACKRILARTAMEAGTLNDYWIDTEHLLLGILAEPACDAAEYLSRAGLTLKTACRMVMENKPSRPDYGPVPLSAQVQSPLEKLIAKWRRWRANREP
jgi:ATP-dependent Clp protease ATP-binding subunit ClpA